MLLPVSMSRAEDGGSLQRVVSGVVPAEIISGLPRNHVEREMHGGAGSGGYHVVVALFDAKTKARIVDAQVVAQLVAPPRSGTEIRLEPMAIDGAQTYGNYLNMVSGGSYQIDVSVRRTGAAEPIHATFHWVTK